MLRSQDIANIHNNGPFNLQTYTTLQYQRRKASDGIDTLPETGDTLCTTHIQMDSYSYTSSVQV